jgi:hypothetical protein
MGIRMRFTTVKLVYKNMTWGRPKIGLYGLITLALLLTTNLYFSIAKIGGNVTAIFFAAFALISWFVILPCIMTMIDLHTSPKRMEKIMEMVTKQ